jgi:hypothetical protein
MVGTKTIFLTPSTMARVIKFLDAVGRRTDARMAERPAKARRGGWR